MREFLPSNFRLWRKVSICFSWKVLLRTEFSFGLDLYELQLNDLRVLVFSAKPSKSI